MNLINILPSSPSLCIPRVFHSVTEEKIRNVLNTLKFGIIRKIEIIEKKNQKEEKFKCVFIHFKKWNENETIHVTREKLLLGGDIKIMYDEPWFWKISAYKSPNYNSFKNSIPNTINNTINNNVNNNVNNNSFVSKTYANVTKPKLLWIPRTPSCSPPRKRDEKELEKKE